MRREAEYRSEKAETYFDQENETILGLLPVGAKRFLDVECGAGANGLAVKSRVPGAVVHGIESDEAALRQSAEVLDYAVGADLNREFPVLESNYDCVIS